MAPTDNFMWLIYRLKAGRIRVRWPMEAPWIMYLKAWYQTSKIGVLSIRVSDMAHNSG